MLSPALLPAAPHGQVAVLRMLIDAAQGLEYLASVGVVHGDVKARMGGPRGAGIALQAARLVWNRGGSGASALQARGCYIRKRDCNGVAWHACEATLS